MLRPTPVVLVALLGGCVDPGTCPVFGAPEAVGEVDEGSLTEASGLVASRAHPGVWWSHNDSGDRARVFALADDGTDLGTFDVTASVQVDWEDVALAADGDGWSLLVGDIGDNELSQVDVIVWRVAEPDPAVPGPTASAEGLHWTYPDGPHDAETLLVDPRTGDAFVVTKDAAGPRLYRAAAPLATGTTLEDAGAVDLGDDVAAEDARITGGDVTVAGDRIVLRSHDTAWTWAIPEGASVPEALAAPPCPAVIADDEHHGEAIGWTLDGGGYVTVGEGDHPTLWRVAVR